MDIRVQIDPFIPGALLDEFSGVQTGAGAIVSFTGLVRDLDGELQAMEIEHYPGMTEKALMQIIEEAQARWPLLGTLIVHRYGTLTANEPIMMVATASKHRKAAFEAADFLMDYLKSRAPFWKREITAQTADWVDATKADEIALKSWD